MKTLKSVNPDFEHYVTNAVLAMPAAVHLGFTFGRVTPGEAEIIQPYRKELTQNDGFFQGGVIGSLADFAGGSAAGTLLAVGWTNMTIAYTVNILAPAKGEKLIARGHVIKAGKAITVAAADIFSVHGSEEILCATSFVTMRNVKLPDPVSS